MNPALQTTDQKSTPAQKTVCDSRVEHRQLMRPHQGNFAGNVHGGTILAMMDEVAYTCASQYAESYCVTASVDMVDFLEPVRVGEVVTMKAAVNYVGRSSMEVGISVEAGQPHDKTTKRRTNRCYFTMVALDDDGKPRAVPQLVLESSEDRKWNCEAELRRDLRERYRKDLESGVCGIPETFDAWSKRHPNSPTAISRSPRFTKRDPRHPTSHPLTLSPSHLLT